MHRDLPTLVRPDRVLEQLAAHHPFDRPRALLARVEGPPDQPHVSASIVLSEQPPIDELERARVTEQRLEELGLTWGDEPYDALPVVVPVVVRPGSCWWSWDESEVLLGLRYGSNGVRVRQVGPYVVTAQGWYAPFDELWDTAPRAVWARC